MTCKYTVSDNCVYVCVALVAWLKKPIMGCMGRGGGERHSVEVQLTVQVETGGVWGMNA